MEDVWERYDRIFHGPVKIPWDTYRPPRRRPLLYDGESTRADALWVVGGMSLIAALAIAALVAAFV
jgi:hypothetical protein